MMKLLRKDWRVFRAAVLGGAALAACPYAVVLSMQVLYPPQGGNTLRSYGVALEQSAMAGLLLSLVMAAVFGGIAFAAERRDRSAEFMALLPVRRWPAVLSKLLVAVPCVALPAAVHLCVGLVGTQWRTRADYRPFMVGHLVEGILVFTCLAVLFFGLAWMLSIYLHSPAVATSVAIGIAVFVAFVVEIWAGEYARVHSAARPNPNVTAGAVGVVLGAVAFAASTAHYLRRVRP
jgi:hypothetical protein